MSVLSWIGEGFRELGLHVIADQLLSKHGESLIQTVVQKVTSDVRAKLFNHIQKMVNAEARKGVLDSYNRARSLGIIAEDRWVDQMSRLIIAIEDPNELDSIFEIFGMMSPSEQDSAIDLLENNKIAQFFERIAKFFKELNQAIINKLRPINEAIETGLSNSKTAKGIRTDDIFSKMRDGLR